jgi:hypothetical protein
VGEEFNGRKNRGRWRKKRVTGMLLPPVNKKEWALEEKELSDAWSFCSRRWQGWGTAVNCSSRRWRSEQR